MEKIKAFIHKHKNLEKIILYIWGIFWIRRAEPIFKKIKHNLIDNKNPKVLVLAVRSIPTTNLIYSDAIFGHGFRKIGCDVKMLFCDGVLSSCDADTLFRKDQKPQCFTCKKSGSRLKKSLNLDYISYRDYISDSDVREIKEKVSGLTAEEVLDYEYLGVKVGVHAQTSAVRYFLLGRLNLSNFEEASMLKEKLVFSMITAKVAQRVVEKERPDVIFMLHGVFSTWGPFLDYFRLKGINSVVYSNMPVRFGHFIFYHNNNSTETVAKKTWLNFSSLPLTKSEQARVDSFLHKRSLGLTGDQKMYKKNFKDKLEKEELLKSLFKKEYSKRYIMYPNLAWDSGVVGKEKHSIIFNDVFSWVDETVRFFKNRKDYQLVIKPHPAELVWEKCRQGIKEYILQKHGPLPKNISILEANTSLRAYDLAVSGAICLTFHGTIGLELAVQGVPVIAVADVHYKDAGVVYGVKTKEEYLNLLGNSEEVVSFAKNNLELAKKYAYFWFFKSMIRIPFYRDDKWSTIDWDLARNTEKLFNDDSNVIKICKRIINKEEIVNPL